MKTTFNKALVVTSLVLGSLAMAPSAQALVKKTNFDGCTPAKTMYFSYTKNGVKAVEFCEVAGGYRYTFGPINRPDMQEMQVTKKPGEIGQISIAMTKGFAMKNGDTFYWINSDKYGNTELVVSKGGWADGKDLARIALDEGGTGFVNKAYDGNNYAPFAY